eukprot:TRINITY_DN22609_c0_g2_i1.p1 TRINITY_DN22609_c0_g2~~TRINITY_DN22609_c0_g2_i1.p1  ORF type:complete len:189 (+),score=66.75 TRINITY_DN22609_c0_g2_i1:139-705(+)
MARTVAISLALLFASECRLAVGTGLLSDDAKEKALEELRKLEGGASSSEVAAAGNLLDSSSTKGLNLKSDNEAARKRVQEELAKLETSRRLSEETAHAHAEAKARVMQELAKLEAMQKSAAPKQSSLNVRQSAPAAAAAPSSTGGLMEKVFGKAAVDAATAEDTKSAVNLQQKGALLSRNRKSKREEL